jgi:hypothetical protein
VVARIAGKQLKLVRKLTRDIVRRLLEFETSWQINRYLNREMGQWRYEELEAELHNTYPVRGLGIRATRGNIGRARALRGGFLVEDVLLAPEDAVGEIWRFPLDAASCSYAFAILEAHGNELADAMGGSRQANDWHRAVPASLDPQNRNQVSGSRAQLAQALGIPRARITLRLMERIAALKELRNRIVHEGEFQAAFDVALGEMLGVACELHFTCIPGDLEVVVYPWTDYGNDFHPQHDRAVHFRRA